MPQPSCTPKRRRRRSLLTTLAGCLAGTAVVAYVVADRKDEFATALGAAPLPILLAAAALQVIALVSRTLRAGGAALAAAAGVLLTATGTLGALAYAAWAAIDRLWTLRSGSRHRSTASRPPVVPSREPLPAIGATR